MHPFWKAASCLLLACTLAGCASSSRPSGTAERLAGLMTDRLSLAREVARDKQRTGAPVHDPARETAILADLSARAADHGLARGDVEAFFAAQIAASRQVQTELLARWSAGEPLPTGTPLDLKTELRPRLDALTGPLLDTLAETKRNRTWQAAARHARSRLGADGFSEAAINLAIAPLDTWAVEEARRRAAVQRDERRRLRTLTPALGR